MSIAERLDEPVLAELHSYWSGQCRGRLTPARRDIDPVDIPHLLPHIALTEIVDRGAGQQPRIRYRLAGTQIEQHFGCALTNRFLDELLEGPFIEYITGLYARLMNEVAPLYSESKFGAGSSVALQAKRLMLPLSDDQTAVTMVLSGVIFKDSSPNDRETVLQAHGRFQPSVSIGKFRSDIQPETEA
ncbi:MAG: PAS domain-containing protein [Kiloniellaceae bacterium]